MRVWKVVIADDEALVRVGLRMSFPWEAESFELVGEAGDGMEALQLCDRTRPDVLITDIKMPKLDGIGLIRRLRETLPGIQIVVLSGFNDFEYVRQALTLGACDYLLKLSLDIQELVKILRTIRESGADDAADGYSDASIPECCQQCFSGEQVVMAIQTDGIPELRARLNGKDEVRFLQSVVNVMIQCLRDAQLRFEIRYAGNFRWNLRLSCEQNENLLRRVYMQLNETLQTCFAFTISAGVSDSFTTDEQLEEACGQAGAALALRFFSGNETLSFFDTSKQQTYRPVNTHEQDLIMGYEIHDAQRTQSLLNDTLTQVEQKLSGHPVRAYRILQEIMYIMIHIQKREKIYAEMVDGNETAISQLEAIQTFEAGAELLRERDREIQHRLSQLAWEQGVTDVVRVKAYIQKNFEHNISLHDIARHVSMNDSYLSALFSKKTGISITEYITSLRLAKAKNLLRHSDQRIYQIALECGYTDESYFGKVFKKYEGCTPHEYRNPERNKNETN